MMFFNPKLIKKSKDVLDVNSFIDSIYGNMKNVKVYQCRECWCYYLTFKFNDKKYCYKYHYNTVDNKLFKNNYLRNFTWLITLEDINCGNC